jgi:hypothetical protein
MGIPFFMSSKVLCGEIADYLQGKLNSYYLRCAIKSFRPNKVRLGLTVAIAYGFYVLAERTEEAGLFKDIYHDIWFSFQEYGRNNAERFLEKLDKNMGFANVHEGNLESSLREIDMIGNDGLVLVPVKKD